MLFSGSSDFYKGSKNTIPEKNAPKPKLEVKPKASSDTETPVSSKRSRKQTSWLSPSKS